MAAALTSGIVASEIATVHAERSKNIRRRKDPITGVSEFPNIHEKPVGAAQAPARPNEDLKKLVNKLPGPSNGALTKALVDAARGGAHFSAMRAALLSENNTSIAPLPSIRLAEDFEHLRDLGDAFLDKFGQRPKTFLANMGRASEFTARASFAKNFFEAGGIEAVYGEGGSDVAAIVHDFKSSGASFVAICSSDAVYVEHAALAAKALKKAGAAIVYLAGRPGDLEASLKDAGVGGFIFIGCDAHAILTSAHDLLKAGQ
jgi:methylmalonyl-CoA mutase